MVTFAVDKDKNSLLANNHPIFPPSTATPMRLHATRYRDDAKLEYFSLAYSLDVKPLQSSSSSSGGIVLEMTFLDRSITQTIVVELHDQRNGLDISTIRLDPRRGASHWHAQIYSYVSAVKSRLSLSAEKDKSSAYYLSPSHSRTNSNIYPSSNRAFLHHLRPVILPALLGVLACLIACGIGFVLGRVLAVAYLYFQAGEQDLGSTDLPTEDGDGERAGEKKSIPPEYSRGNYIVSM